MKVDLKHKLIPFHVGDKLIELSDRILYISEMPAFFYLGNYRLYLD